MLPRQSWSSMASRVIAIGDVHGCSIALRNLIHSIQPKQSDTIVTLGDYVNRGPDVGGSRCLGAPSTNVQPSVFKSLRQSTKISLQQKRLANSSQTVTAFPSVQAVPPKTPTEQGSRRPPPRKLRVERTAGKTVSVRHRRLSPP
ncbi:metallophosphoesterase [Stieleria neptunia]|uniref:metallophosphoesterase n=1 Tax=Stieleria neptunia TaxID=2527979 RepID=UPI0036F26206